MSTEAEEERADVDELLSVYMSRLWLYLRFLPTVQRVFSQHGKFFLPQLNDGVVIVNLGYIKQIDLI